MEKKRHERQKCLQRRKQMLLQTLETVEPAEKNEGRKRSSGCYNKQKLQLQSEIISKLMKYLEKTNLERVVAEQQVNTNFWVKSGLTKVISTLNFWIPAFYNTSTA